MKTLAAIAALSLGLPNLQLPNIALLGGGPEGPVAPPPASSTADWRTPDPENLLVIDTNKGRVIVELAPEIAPKSVERIKTLTRQGFYDGRTFFRVIADFMDQTGSPTDNGQGGSSLPDLQAELDFRRSPTSTTFVRAATVAGTEIGFVGSMPVRSQPTPLAALSRDGLLAASTPFCAGVMGMARGSDLDSANSQFYLMRQETHTLDKIYTAAGRVIAGLDVVRAIKVGEPVPQPQDKMLTVKLVADMPEASRPKVKVIDPKGPWFTARLKAATSRDPASFNPCDVDIPAQVQ